MDKIIIGLLAFLIVYVLFGGIIKRKIKENIQKDLESVSLGKPVPVLADELESIVARNAPGKYNLNRSKVRSSMNKIAKATKTGELFLLKTDSQMKSFIG
jgi:hypothetical protein